MRVGAFSLQPKTDLSGNDRQASGELPGTWLERNLIFPAKNLWARILACVKRLPGQDDSYQNTDNSSEIEKEEARGRPTIPDNFPTF